MSQAQEYTGSLRETIDTEMQESIHHRTVAALREFQLWNRASVWVAAGLSIVSAFQAHAALSAIGMAGGGQINQVVCGVVAVALIAASNTVAAKMSALGFFARCFSLIILAMILVFSTATSGYWLANVMITADHNSTQNTPAVIRARSDWRRAVGQADAIEESAKAAKTISDANHIRTGALMRAEARVEDARKRLELALAGSGGVTGESAALHAAAKEIGMDTKTLALWAACFVVLLAELVRLASCIESASILRKMRGPLGNARNQTGAVT